MRPVGQPRTVELRTQWWAKASPIGFCVGRKPPIFGFTPIREEVRLVRAIISLVLSLLCFSRKGKSLQAAATHLLTLHVEWRGSSSSRCNFRGTEQIKVRARLRTLALFSDEPLRVPLLCCTPNGRDRPPLVAATYVLPLPHLQGCPATIVRTYS